MNQPYVRRFAAAGSDGRSVAVTVSTDIIDHIDSSRTFGREDLADLGAHGRYQRRLIAVPDRRLAVTTPMVLTISSLNGLFLVRRDEGSAGGWKLIDLGLDRLVGQGPATVRALGAAWTDDDRITVAVAVDEGPAPSRSRVFVAYDLSSRGTDWGQINWTDYGAREGVRVEAIRVLDEGDGTWTVVLAGDRGPNDTVYLLRGGRTPSFAQAPIFSPAVTLEEILDFEAGVHPTLGGGLHVLGVSGGARALSFRPFPEYDESGRPANIPPVVPLPCPPGANVLETGVTRGGGSDLYVGGQGLQLITADELDNMEEARVARVAGADAAPEVQDVVVGSPAGGGAVVWGLSANGDLNVVRRGADGWGTSLRLRTGVQEVAPVEGDGHAVTSLLVVYSDYSAAFLWLDASSGVWQETPLHVADPGQAASVTCYGTSLRLLDEAGSPRPGVSVRVSASVLSSVTLNGGAVFVGPAVTVEALTDSNGAVTLFDRVRSLTPAVYRFAVEGLDGPIDVNPAGGVHERFRTVTADELRAATVPTPGGSEPLLPEKFRTGAARNQVDAVAGTLNRASILAATASGPVAGVRQAGAGEAFSSVLRLAALPDGYRWGVQADAKGVRAAGPEVLDRLAGAAGSAERFFVGLGETVADFFEGLGRRIKEGFTCVLSKAREAFEVVCELGDKVKRFALKTLEEVGSFFKWLWQQVETGLEKLWDFLKFLFEWEDIIRVRDAMVEATDDALKYLASAVGGMKGQVTDGFDAVIKKIESWRAEAGEPPAKPPRPNAGESFLDDIKGAAKPVEEVMDLVSGNSVVAWVVNKMESFASEVVQFDGPNPVKEAAEAAAQFVEGVIADEFKDLTDTWGRIQDDLTRMFDGRMPGGGELSFDTIKGALIAVSADSVEGLLTGVRDLLLRALDLTQSLILVARDALFTRLRFPLIEKLVELVTFGRVKVGSLRLIDGLMLLLAVPATIGYKLIFGEAPLAEGEGINLLPYAGVTAQSGSEQTRRNARIVGLVASFLKLLTVPFQGLNALRLKSAPVGMALMWFNAAVATMGLAVEGIGMHPSKGTLVRQLEGIMLATSCVMVAKVTAITAAVGMKKLPAGDAPAANAAADIPLNFVHFVFKTAVFSLIIDEDRKSDPVALKKDRTPESLAFVEEFFDRAGSILVSAAVLANDAKVKAGLFVGGGVSRGVAFGVDIGRVIDAGV